MYRRIKKRDQYISVKKNGVYTPASTLIVQYLPGEPFLSVGFTASRKVGGAVDRNRAKRRLREAIKIVTESLNLSAGSLVVIAKKQCVTASFDVILGDLGYGIRQCLKKCNQTKEGISGHTSES